MEKLVMTLPEVAMLLRVAPKTIYRLVDAGKLPAFKVAGVWRFQRADVQSWMNEQKRLARNKTQAPSPKNEIKS